MDTQAVLDTLKQQLIEALETYRLAIRNADQDCIWFYRGQVDAFQAAIDVVEAAIGDSK